MLVLNGIDTCGLFRKNDVYIYIYVYNIHIYIYIYLYLKIYIYIIGLNPPCGRVQLKLAVMQKSQL